MPKCQNQKTSLSSATRRSPPVSCTRLSSLYQSSYSWIHLFPLWGRIHPYNTTNLLLSNSSRLESFSLWWCRWKQPPRCHCSLYKTICGVQYQLLHTVHTNGKPRWLFLHRIRFHHCRFLFAKFSAQYTFPCPDAHLRFLTRAILIAIKFFTSV